MIADFMLGVMLDDRERTRDRLEAARFLSDRGFGRPVQALDVDVSARLPLIDPARLAQLTDDELGTMLTLLERIESPE